MALKARFVHERDWVSSAPERECDLGKGRLGARGCTELLFSVGWARSEHVGWDFILMLLSQVHLPIASVTLLTFSCHFCTT
jgi:hypothetical protein